MDEAPQPEKPKAPPAFPNRRPGGLAGPDCRRAARLQSFRERIQNTPSFRLSILQRLRLLELSLQRFPTLLSALVFDLRLHLQFRSFLRPGHRRRSRRSLKKSVVPIHDPSSSL